MDLIRRPAASYILPIRREIPDLSLEFASYLRWLDSVLELVIVDGSKKDVFAAHGEAWQGLHHVAPAPDVAGTNGKVRGVLTGLRVSRGRKVVIADEDVRYDETSLTAILEALNHAHIVRPQNFFDPAPWHALLDSARILINRATGGDWPGTLAVRREALDLFGGYRSDCLFENLELVRTIKASGGRELVALDIYVRRLPPTTRHFLSQRVRQAYDEFARPARLVFQLAWLPMFLVSGFGRRGALLKFALASIAIAEAGRRRAGGARFFPARASLLAPIWMIERAVCAWVALYYRLVRGGMPYAGAVVRDAASNERVLRETAIAASRIKKSA